MADAIGAPERVEDGIDDRRRGTDGARLARALNAERIGFAGDVAGFEAQRREVVRARQGIIEQAAARGLAGDGIVAHVLHQRLPDALGAAAMDLAGEQQWIERHADIVHHHIVDEMHGAGVGIDLDLGEMRAIGIGGSQGRKRVLP